MDHDSSKICNKVNEGAMSELNNRNINVYSLDSESLEFIKRVPVYHSPCRDHF